MIGAEPGVQGASLNDILRQAEIQPPGVNVNEPDLSTESHSLAVTCGGPAVESSRYTMQRRSVVVLVALHAGIAMSSGESRTW